MYTYAMNTEPVKYTCRLNSTDSFTDCSIETVCQNRGLSGFEFLYKRDDPGYFENWLERFDLMCVDKFKVNFVVSYWYIGYLFGMFFFFMPDSIGRKKTIMIFFSLNIAGHAMALFSEDLTVKSIGFFLVGCMHIKNSCSFQYCSELFPKNY